MVTGIDSFKEWFKGIVTLIYLLLKKYRRFWK